MSGPDLDAELRRNAEQTVELILGEARAEATRLAAEAEQELARRRASVMEDKEAEHRAEARVLVAAERHAAMEALLLARTRVVERVLGEARVLLPQAARSEPYQATLAKELNEALQFVDTEGAAVRCSVDLEPSVREALGNRPEVKVEAERDMGAGFVVGDAAERVLVDGRLETRIDRLASTLAIEIHAQLRSSET